MAHVSTQGVRYMGYIGMYGTPNPQEKNNKKKRPSQPPPLPPPKKKIKNKKGQERKKKKKRGSYLCESSLGGIAC